MNTASRIDGLTLKVMRLRGRVKQHEIAGRLRVSQQRISWIERSPVTHEMATRYLNALAATIEGDAQ